MSGIPMGVAVDELRSLSIGKALTDGALFAPSGCAGLTCSLRYCIVLGVPMCEDWEIV
jgi:hypothetical protein